MLASILTEREEFLKVGPISNFVMICWRLTGTALLLQSTMSRLDSPITAWSERAAVQVPHHQCLTPLSQRGSGQVAGDDAIARGTFQPDEEARMLRLTFAGKEQTSCRSGFQFNKVYRR